MERLAHLVDPEGLEPLDIMGARIELITEAGALDEGPCVMRGVIPPGGVVPLHSHHDPETLIALSGEVEGLVHADGSFSWVRIEPSQIFHVPSGARHAFRNLTQAPAVSIIVGTARLARFFREVGIPVARGSAPGLPTAKGIQHFLATAARFGHWNATPEENARVGLKLAIAS